MTNQKLLVPDQGLDLGRVEVGLELGVELVLVELVEAVPQAGAATMDLIAEAQDWPKADQFVERLQRVMGIPSKEEEEALQNQPPQGPSPEEIAAGIELQKKVLENEKLQVEIDEKQQKLNDKSEMTEAVQAGVAAATQQVLQQLTVLMKKLACSQV